MNRYSLSHLSDDVLVRGLITSFSNEREATALTLAHLAEFDERRLYLPAGYSSMYAYCLGALRMPEDSAWRRIVVARAGRRFPLIFEMLADGRLHQAAVLLLAPHLTAGNSDEFLAAAVHRRKAEVEELIASHYPRPDAPAVVRSLSPQPVLVAVAQPPLHEQSSGNLPAPVRVDVDPALNSGNLPAPVRVNHPPDVEPALQEPPIFSAPSLPEPRPRVQPIAHERFAIQFTIDGETRGRLRYAQELLGHELPSGDLARVFALALRDLIARLEKRKFAATNRPRESGAAISGGRHVPAAVKRAVWQRDGGRCTFVGQDGHRCGERTRLEFDHVRPFAHGGETREANLRLRCRAHNQFGAELSFGRPHTDERWKNGGVG